MFKKIINSTKLISIITLLLVVIVFAQINKTIAVKYGAGLYGDCVYGGEIGNSALSFTVSASSVNLSPNISTSATAYSTTTFSVSEKCSDSGYVVSIIGSPPIGGAYTLANLTSPTASTAGTEQYGINLVSNSLPSVGSNPAGGSGIASTGYDSTNLYKYVSGNTIASTATKSDTTTYTISFIANVSKTTPARTYTTLHTLICTATY